MAITDGRSRILIVDDSPEGVRMLGEALRADYDVAVATNGEDALEVAAAEPQPDIILLDVMLPKMHGFHVCGRLKASDRTRHIPVIFLTALNDDASGATGFRLGAADYIPKPFYVPWVQARVAVHLELMQHRAFLELVRSQYMHLLAAPQKRALNRLYFQYCQRPQLHQEDAENE